MAISFYAYFQHELATFFILLSFVIGSFIMIGQINCLPLMVFYEL
jgi:hypothetical protein